MAALTRPFRRRFLRRTRDVAAAGPEQRPEQPETAPEQAPVEIAPNDPLLAYFQSAGEAVDIEELELDSPALRELKAAGVKLAVPLVSQGELIGVLNLGPRLSEQEYSSDDRKLLDNLAPKRRRRCGSASSCANSRPRPPRASASSRSSRSPS